MSVESGPPVRHGSMYEGLLNDAALNAAIDAAVALLSGGPIIDEFDEVPLPAVEPAEMFMHDFNNNEG